MKAKQPKRFKAKEQKRNDGARAYRLTNSDRIEWLTPIMARARNQNRRDGKTWVEDGEVFADQVKETVKLTSFADWRSKLAAGISRDNQVAAERFKAQKEREAAMGKDNKTATKEKGEKSTTNSKGGKARAEWKGLGMCEIIRLCGKKGFGKTKTLTVAKKLGLDPNPATISIQLNKGRNGQNVPELGKDIRGEFNKIADGIPNDEKKASKKKTTEGSAKGSKGSKKAGKVKGSKKSSKKAETTDDGDDDEEAQLAAARAEAQAAEDADGEEEEEGSDEE